MTNRLLPAVGLVVALMLLIGATTIAAPQAKPKPEPISPARQVIVKVYQASGTIAKAQVAFDAKDYQLMRFYIVEEYAPTMRVVTAIVKDLSAKGEEASPAFDAVQSRSLRHIASLKKMHGSAPTKEVKAVIAFGIDESQRAHDAAAAAIAKTGGR